MDADEKIRLKRARNKASARESRKRKREKVDEIKKQITLMEASNMQLRSQLNAGHSAPIKERIEGHEKGAEDDFMMSQIAARLQKMLKEGAPDDELKNLIVLLREKYSDYGQDKRSAIDFHIDQLRVALIPNLVTRVGLWILKISIKRLSEKRKTMSSTSVDTDSSNNSSSTSSPATADGATAPTPALVDGIFDSQDQKNFYEDCMAAVGGDEEDWVKLLGEGITSTEGIALMELFEGLDRNHATADARLVKLQEMANERNFGLEREKLTLNKIFTDKQMAKLYVWIDKNPAIMQMLEVLWPHLINKK